MNKPMQYLLVGYPYSGKTTLAKELVKKFNFAHINIDELKWKRGYTEVGDDEVPDRVWDEIFEEADKLIVKYLKEGRNLANEYAWINKSWRGRARKVAKDVGFETKVIYIKIPEEEIRKRRKDNIENKTHFHWPEEEFERIFKDFEEPSDDENILLYDGSQSIETWARQL